jgi:hypothetical protein
MHSIGKQLAKELRENSPAGVRAELGAEILKIVRQAERKSVRTQYAINGKRVSRLAFYLRKSVRRWLPVRWLKALR